MFFFRSKLAANVHWGRKIHFHPCRPHSQNLLEHILATRFFSEAIYAFEPPKDEPHTFWVFIVNVGPLGIMKFCFSA